MKAIASNGAEIKTGDEILVRNSTKGAWLFCHFSHIDENEERKYFTSNIAHKYCIPFKGNEDLVGTRTDFIKPFKFKFGAKVKALDGLTTGGVEQLGILINYMNDRSYKFKVAFQVNNNADEDWFSEIEYLE